MEEEGAARTSSEPRTTTRMKSTTSSTGEGGEATAGEAPLLVMHRFVFEDESRNWSTSTTSTNEEGHQGNLLHAHFDCFSGAAGDMMLAACLDAAGSDCDRLCDHIGQCLSEGIPVLAGEFRIRLSRVWRGPGSLAAKYVKVESVYGHKAAPVPLRANNDAAAAAATTTATDATHSHAHHSHSHASPPRHAQVGFEGHHEHEHSSSSSGPLRSLPEIRSMLQNASDAWIPHWVKETAIQTFTQLALAEAAVHGAESEDHVHFHEVGAIDSIVDTVGTLLALYFLGVKSVSCGKLPLGEGHVKTDHGILPVPTPATLCLLIGMPTTKGPPKAVGELVTPTGAALLQVLTRLHPVAPLGEPPSFTLRHVGVGAGTKDYRYHPNILRVMLGELSKRDSDKSGDSESSANATESSAGL